MDLTFGIRRTPWRQLVRPAAEPSLDGVTLMGPNGVVAGLVEPATRPARRARGLVGRPDLPSGSAMMLAPCAQVHTFGMRFPIDAVFCDRDLRVLATVTLEPRRVSRMVMRAWCCFEMPAGAAERAGLGRGTQLGFQSP